MFFNLFKKEEKRVESLNEIYSKLKKLYKVDEISDDRKIYLNDLMDKNGFLPYPHIKALEELSNAEVLFALEKKWINEGVMKNGVFSFENSQISVLSRRNIKHSDWIKKEQHNVKLINLAGLGDGNKSEQTGKFMDWLRQLLILPTGKIEKEILNTTIYLIPFHPREFGCAYLPSSYNVSSHLLDEEIKEKIGLDENEQVKLFIELAQLAGHPVIYDILPQTGRFSKLVLSNPSIARWFDIPKLIKLIEVDIEQVAIEMAKNHDEDDVEIVKNIALNLLNSGAGEISENYKELYDKFLEKLLINKKVFSNEMMKKENQVQLAQRVRKIVAKINGNKPQAQLNENDITKQGEIIQELIKEGLWPAPGGAWCSAGVPIFDKMSECATYPMFRHFNFKNEDVTHFANLDCQTPFYFAFLENGQLNQPVINFYINFLKNLQKEFNFDGFRVDHIDHIVDEVSEKNGLPISYRIPQKVLEKVNSSMKEKIPYFATLAEYMLWDGFYKEYHQNMKFDLLWGNDIILQNEKNPEKIVEDNQTLAQYNTQNLNINNLSILKTYNNQDGEFREINQYPALLGEKGALFKWFKLKFLPGGKNAQRPVMFVDGDESFTQKGIEAVIGAEISMPRAKNYDFYNKFEAIRKFALENELTREGEAEIILQEEDGFVVWIISKEMVKESLLVVANWLPETYEKEEIESEESAETNAEEQVETPTTKSIELPCDYTIVSELKIKENSTEFEEIELEEKTNKLTVEILEQSEFRIFKLIK